MAYSSKLLVPLFAFFVLYGPQPLLPRLAEVFAVTHSRAALIMTATLVPLAVAPVAYGAVLARVSARTVLLVSVAGLGIFTIGFGLVESFPTSSFPAAVTLRLGQGLLLPAILTATMTALSETTATARMQAVMSAYIATTVAGGLGGRLLAGVLATNASWTHFFVLVGAALLASLPVIWRIPAGSAAATRPTGGWHLRAVLRRRSTWRIYLAIACLFFVFVGVLTFLPFRVKALAPATTDQGIALLYCGYLMGIVASLAAPRLIARVGTPGRTLLAGYAIYALSVPLLLVGVLPAVFAAIFVFCFGMFLVHAIASSWVNERAGEARGLVNGLYVASYYSGGVLGSYLPGLVFERFGWAPMLAGLLGIAAIGLVLAASAVRADRAVDTPPHAET
ncbi:MFS transporter, YNFM family, putative membrane transport protein [Limimonas halophila]|uniref:MFS transporter, YNFM family, putative membrane transport protein n=1 Tax=Limimonas halophila TaxID=1082479 RepID=A0A1G7Q1Y8_9PROT|nr:MFS transporter [Limimonas halophila]SDF92478.1 MFS transporter, YNFM family, putative membrane transport protein [Limimonas halophila]